MTVYMYKMRGKSIQIRTLREYKKDKKRRGRPKKGWTAILAKSQREAFAKIVFTETGDILKATKTPTSKRWRKYKY